MIVPLFETTETDKILFMEIFMKDQDLPVDTVISGQPLLPMDFEKPAGDTISVYVVDDDTEYDDGAMQDRVKTLSYLWDEANIAVQVDVLPVLPEKFESHQQAVSLILKALDEIGYALGTNTP